MCFPDEGKSSPVCTTVQLFLPLSQEHEQTENTCGSDYISLSPCSASKRLHLFFSRCHAILLESDSELYIPCNRTIVSYVFWNVY